MKKSLLQSIVFSCYLFMLLGTLVLFGVNQLRTPDLKGDSALSQSADFSAGWEYADGTPAVLDKLNAAQDHIIGSNYTLSKQLPAELPRDQVLMFRSNSLCFRLTIDDTVLYSYGMESAHVFGNSTGFGVHRVDIPKEAAGKQLCLTFSVSYNADYERLTDMQLGTGDAMLLNILKENLFGVVTCIVLLTIGLLYVLLDIPLSYGVSRKHSLLYLGVFAMVVGFWSLTETHIPDLFFYDDQALNCLSLMMLSLVAIPLALFLSDIFAMQRKLLFVIGYGGSVAGYVLCMVLYLTGAADYSQTLTISHLVIAYFLVLTVYTLTVNIRAGRCSGAEMRLIVIGIAQLTVCVIIDLLASKVAYHADNSRFTRVGMVIMVLCFGMVIGLQTMQRLKKAGQLEFVSQLAYKDGLTGIGNRTAFNERVEACTAKQQESHSLCVVMFDVNNLKVANDRYGHQQGDVLIQGASTVIRDTFSALGDVYRIGGDEFAAILSGVFQPEQVDALFQTLDRQIAAFNSAGSCPVPLSIARGYACAQSFSETMDMLIQTADERMYVNKREMKGGAPVR